MTSLDLFGEAPAGLFDSPPPRWRTIAAHRPFLDDLAAGLHASLSTGGPEALADAVVLTPTRRGARALAEAFVAVSGGQALLLPQIRALGDLEEGEPPFEPGDLALDLPPAVSPLRRRFELARLVVEHQHDLKRTLDAAAALDLADALAGFLDALQIEERDDPDAVERLVEGELAKHWEISAKFLAIAQREWPRRLEDLGLVDVAARRTALLRALADRWRDDPPGSALIAAGSTGAAPAEADLLAVIASAPRGLVVLPGLDQELADDAWAQVGEAHPQGALKRLLERARVGRADVLPWISGRGTDDPARGRARRRVLNEALRPPEATADWLALIGRLGPGLIAEGLEGLTVLCARNEEDAAAQAALLLREALEEPGRTAALVTPDPALARRVSARLARWGIAADSSAGSPLSASPAGSLMSLVAAAVMDPLDPALLLAIAKHPLARLGLPELSRERALRDLERKGLRGPRPPSWTALATRLQPRDTEPPEPLEKARALADALRAAIDHAGAPFASGLASAQAALRALAEAMEMIATDGDGRLGDLWAGAGGEAAAALAASVIDEGAALPPTTSHGFAQLVEGLVLREVVRTGGNAHPRLRILGLIEARLIRADRLVLAGLEEGTWPRAPATDPFLSRPMRNALGLPPPERRTGQAAHDFAQAACAPEVTLIHAERRDGQPAVKSRWLWRLETLARGAGVGLPSRPEVAAWARGLDAPVAPPPPSLAAAPRPSPTPPAAVRPRELAVTRIETWLRDPYSTYARYVLRLKPLDRPDAPVEAMARGSAIHRAFERYARKQAEDPPPGAPEFEAMLIEALAEEGMPQPRMARERALARRLSGWVVEFERRRREGASVLVESEGKWSFAAPGGPFTVTAKADRLEARVGGVDVMDFKTGSTPSAKQVRSGFSPQLTLTAAIIAHGGFEPLGVSQPGDLIYVRVTGRGEGAEAQVRAAGGGESADLAARALQGLAEHVARFDDPATPYLSWTAPQFIGRRGSDYDHLARLWEWHVMGEGEEGE